MRQFSHRPQPSVDDLAEPFLYPSYLIKEEIRKRNRVDNVFDVARTGIGPVSQQVGLGPPIRIEMDEQFVFSGIGILFDPETQLFTQGEHISVFL